MSGGGKPAPKARPKPARKAAGGAAATVPSAAAALPRAAVAPTNGRPASSGPVDWSLVEALTVLAVVAAGFLVKDALLAAEWLRLGAGSTQTLVRVLVLALYYAVQVALLAFLARRHDRTFAEAYGLRPPRIRVLELASSAGLVTVLLVATRAATTVYGALAQWMGFQPPVRWNGDLTRVFGNDALGLALTVAMVVIVGPTVEELVFRGVVLRAASARIGVWPAVLVSAALFAAYHFTAWMLVPAFILGVALGWLASRRATLWPAIVLHSLYNAVAVAAAFYVAAN